MLNLKNFLIKEALDYPRYRAEPYILNSEGVKYYRTIEDKIIAEMQKTRVGKLTLRSFTTLGLVDRLQEIQVGQGASCFVDLCPCGKLDHWGAFYKEGKKTFGT